MVRLSLSSKGQSMLLAMHLVLEPAGSEAMDAHAAHGLEHILQHLVMVHIDVSRLEMTTCRQVAVGHRLSRVVHLLHVIQVG